MRQLTKALGTAALLFTAATGAQAAPQMLGVVAAPGPLALQCAGSNCTVDITTLCLEADRTTPAGGEVYIPSDASVFSVLARNDAGKTVKLALTHAVFRAARGYTATRISIDASALRARGLSPVALLVPKGTFLIPAPVPGDKSPTTSAQVQRVKTTLWPLAEQLFKTQRQKVETIGMVNRLLNATPATGPMQAAARADIWQDTIGKPPPETAAGAAHQAADLLAGCQRNVDKGVTFTLRECLQTRVDALLSEVNIEYWRGAAQDGT